MSDAPEFVLLEAARPRPGALALSFALSSTLLVLAVVLARPSSATPASRAEMITEIAMAPGPLWWPADPLAVDSDGSKTPDSDPDPPAQDPDPLLVADPPGEAAASVAPLATVLPKSEPSLRNPPSEVDLPDSKRVSEPAGLTHAPTSDAPKPAPDALPLPRLIEDEAALAASLEALSPGRRMALPRLSIRVDAEWLEALPQTKEELYFSTTKPQGDTEVLAYLPATRGFILKHPLQPLWQIHEAEQVPALAALRSAAATSPLSWWAFIHGIPLSSRMRCACLSSREWSIWECSWAPAMWSRFASLQGLTAA